jgi:starch phosphorylase
MTVKRPTAPAATSIGPAAPARVRTGLTTDAIAEALLDNLLCLLGKRPQYATRNDWYMALAYTIRDRLLDRCLTTVDRLGEMGAGQKIVAYLSAEFLTGPHLANKLLCLGITESTRQALAELGYNLDELLEQEEEPGLGNGGLGRLAACYMDSLATLEVAAIGYGIATSSVSSIRRFAAANRSS